MNWTKKLAALTMAGAMSLSLFGCAGTAPGSSSAGAASTSSVPETPPAASSSVDDNQAAQAPEVSVTGGKISGYVDENGVSTFKGIPYADTTAGENRFKAPQPVKAWDGVLDCTEYGNIAMQNEATTYNGMSPWTAEYLDLGKTVASGEMSEDCLNLNVWTTAKADEKQPVIVYIHGGGNNSGSGACEIYTGEDIAQKGVVYVSLNYRVGIFGFLAYKDANGEEVTGNFGIMDQIAALKWVQENIAQFGGDPSNVTIVGQSAGSGNVQTLIASPAAKGLFVNAAALSGNSYSRRRPLATVADAEAVASEKLGDYTIADLRAMSGEEVQALSADYNPSSTVIDGETVTQSLAQAFDSGDYNKVNMLWGCVTEDRSLFSALTLPDDDGNPYTPVMSVTPDALKASIADAFGDQADICIELYPIDDTQENVLGIAGEINFDAMVSGYYKAAQAKNASDDSHKTWVYNFSHVVPDTPERMAMNGAFHTGDVGYWLNHFTKDAYSRPWTDADYKLGDIMSSYLANFAATGDPNGNGLPQWNDVASTSTISYLNLDDTIDTVEMSADKADFWNNAQ